MSQTERTHRRFPLLVFDWDGTLLDSIASIVACTQQTLRELGQTAADEKRIRAGIGMGLRETVEHLAPGCSDELFDEICRVYRGHWIETFSRRPVLFPGARETLERLRADGYELALATAKSRGGLVSDFETTGVEHLFWAIRTMDEAPGKPHPQMLLDILEELGRRPHEALMIGDALHDMSMARNAGVAAVGVCSGTQSRERLLGAGPLACLEGVGELPDWLAEGDLTAGTAPTP